MGSSFLHFLIPSLCCLPANILVCWSPPFDYLFHISILIKCGFYCLLAIFLFGDLFCTVDEFFSFIKLNLSLLYYYNTKFYLFIILIVISKMTSYFGAHGGVPRCAEFWIDFYNCMQTAPDGRACAPAHADYMECLHHNKEVLVFFLY